MGQTVKLTSILLKSLEYTNGKWVGELELVIHHNGYDNAGYVSFMYDRTWHLHALKYPKGLKEEERETIKQRFHADFKEFSSFVEQQFFRTREKQGIKPALAQLEFNEELSSKEALYVTFTLHNVRETFFMNIQLIEEIWHYKLHSKQHSLDTYKTFYSWEDAVFEQVIDAINQHPTYRLKFVVHAKKFKYK